MQITKIGDFCPLYFDMDPACGYGSRESPILRITANSDPHHFIVHTGTTYFFLSFILYALPIWFCKIDNIVCIIHVECAQEDDYDMHPAIQLFPPFSLVIDNISPVLIGGYLDMQLANQYRYRYSLHSHWSLTKFLLF